MKKYLLVFIILVVVGMAGFINYDSLSKENPSSLFTKLTNNLNNLTAKAQISEQENVSCFDYYQFQNVTTSLSPLNKKTNEVVPGEYLKLEANTINHTPVPIPHGQIKYRLVKIQDNNDVRRTQGDDIFDEGVLVNDVSVKKNAAHKTMVTYQVPKFLPNGNYRMNLYFTQNDRFNWAGLYFTDDVIGSYLPLVIKGAQSQETPTFDRSRTTLNGGPYSHIGFISSPQQKGTDARVTTVFKNPTSAQVSGTVTSKLYTWDQQNQQNLLTTKQEEITVSANQEKDLSFTISKTEYPVYFLEQTFQMKNSSYKNIIFERIGVASTRGRINSFGLSKYPLADGEKTAFYMCYHNGAGKSFEGSVKAQLKDSTGRIVTDLSYQGQISSAISAIKRDIIFPKGHDTLSLSAQVSDKDGKLIDSTEVIYSCHDFDISACTNK